jgi:hypothetical protein
MDSQELPRPPRKVFERCFVVAAGALLAAGLWQGYGAWLLSVPP